jgi:pyridine nucleotide-disulfide oxidoreductase family protein
MRHLFLLGGGHAHVFVLDSLARRPVADLSVTMLTPSARQLYSGMLPGWIAGHYRLDECAIPLDILCRRAGVRLIFGAARRLDPERKLVLCEDGRQFAFDLLSIDTGSASGSQHIPGSAQHALPIRPLENFVTTLERMLAMARLEAQTRIAIVGAGAGGVEIALALDYRLRRECLRDRSTIELIAASTGPLPGLPRSLQRACRELFAARDIGWTAEGRVAEVLRDGMLLADGRRIASSCVLLATGSAAPGWPAASGLATDEAGYIAVNGSLQSISHGDIFAAGDVAALPTPPAKSGVYAVRAGPPLAENLRRALRGRPLRRWRPQTRALYLLSTGGQHALGAWGPFGFRGDWVWRWKDRIDRGFIRHFGGCA